VFFPLLGNGAGTGQIGKKIPRFVSNWEFTQHAKYSLGISFIQGDMKIMHNKHFKTMYQLHQMLGHFLKIEVVNVPLAKTRKTF
jgi:hypothetical protein